MGEKYSELADKLKPFFYRYMDDKIGDQNATGGYGEQSGSPFAILLYDLSAEQINVYEGSGTGLASAIAAAEAGDIIWLPPGTFDQNHTIPADVEVTGCGVNSKLSGAITNGGIASNLRITGSLSTDGETYNVYGAGSASTLAGGSANTTDSAYTFVGGFNNRAYSEGITIFGMGSEASALGSFLAGTNHVDDGTWYNALLGDTHNNDGGCNIIAGHEHNITANGSYNALFGDGNGGGPGDAGALSGNYNLVAGYVQVVSGDYNLVSGDTHTVAGSWNIVGGDTNDVSGGSNLAIGDDHTVAGDYNLVGGDTNVASGDYNIVGGNSSTASGDANLVGGVGNTASGDYGGVFAGAGNTASANYAVSLGGDTNTASGVGSLVWGKKPSATHTGAMLFVDQSNFAFASVANNEFAVRAVGGYRFVSAIDGAGAATKTYSVNGGCTFWTGDATGIPYGSMYQNATGFTVTLTTLNTWYELDAATTNISAGQLHQVTFPDDHYLLVQKAGRYKIDWSAAIQIDTANQGVSVGIMVNGTIQNPGMARNYYLNAARNLTFGSCTILDLAANDQISLGARNITSGARVITVSFENVSVIMVGGT